MNPWASALISGSALYGYIAYMAHTQKEKRMPYVIVDPESVAQYSYTKKTPAGTKAAIARLEVQLAKAQAEIVTLRDEAAFTSKRLAEANIDRVKAHGRIADLEAALRVADQHVKASDEIAQRMADALKEAKKQCDATAAAAEEVLGAPGLISIEPLVAWRGPAGQPGASHVASFRAFIRVPDGDGRDRNKDDVFVATTGFVEGEGRTPEEAVVAMTEALGLAALKGALLGNRPPPPQPPPSPTPPPPSPATPPKPQYSSADSENAFISGRGGGRPA